MDDALKYINDERLAVSELAFRRKYKVEPDLTETWESGWVFYLSPAEEEGNYLRYVVEKHLEKCVPVGTRGVERAIEELYHDQHANDARPPPALQPDEPGTS
jgi:hypothetical protein